MNPDRLASLRYLAVFCNTRPRKFTRIESAAEREQIIKTYDRLERFIRIIDAGKVDVFFGDLPDVLEGLEKFVCVYAEQFVPSLGRTMGYRIKAHIRTVRGEASPKKKGGAINRKQSKQQNDDVQDVHHGLAEMGTQNGTESEKQKES